MDKVSVIIPVFNTQEFIDQSVSSLLQQSHNNLEIIIINDNSNEACKEQLEHLASKDDRIILYHFKENKGVGSARNFGLEKATGEYIYFLDSDDYLPNHTIEILVNHVSTYNMVFGKIKKTHLSEFPEDRDKHD